MRNLVENPGPDGVRLPYTVYSASQGTSQDVGVKLCGLIWRSVVDLSPRSGPRQL